MEFIKAERRERLRSPELAVRAEDAKRLAQFHLYTVVGGRFRGVEGWERRKMGARPTTVYDLSGLPLFYDFAVRAGKGKAGFIRTAANKVFGDPVVEVQVTPPGWDLAAARSELAKKVKRKYPGYAAKRVRLVCYSYPKLALAAELTGARRKAVTFLMDVADFTEIRPEPGKPEEEIGQVPYSLLAEFSERRDSQSRNSWDKADREVRELFKKQPKLQPERLYKLKADERLLVIDNALIKPQLIKLYTQKVLDFCCHTGECKDHECFCLHPQENNVHCARASAQMMLCFWRYCFSQHQIAQAFNAPDNQGTSPSAIVPGLESLTKNCFDATRHNTATWAICTGEINNRRPFMSCVPGHARACAGYKEWHIWIVNTPQPRYLYIFNPWPPNVGAISWENFNTTNYSTSYGAYSLARRTTSHM